MKVSELVSKLIEMPQDADVQYLWDGTTRSEAEFVWLSRGGKVILSDDPEYILYKEDWPVQK